MEELAKSGVLEGQEFAQAIRKLNMSEMYISRRQALKFKCEIATGQTVQKQTMLLDSGAMDCFMDKATVAKLGLKALKMPHPRKVLNVDGTENKAGQIMHYVPFHIQHNNRQEKAIFFVTGLGQDQIILGYPWLEQFNPDIDWENGKILGTEITLKTPAAKQTKHWLREIAIRKTTTAQKMADSYHATQTPKTDLPIPREYQRHAKVFSEEEAKRFPPSREWDHHIPLTKNTPESINQKIFNLPTAGREAIEKWVQTMLDKNFIQRSSSKYGHATFTMPKKDGTFRIVQDYRPVNKVTEKDTTPLSSIQDAVESLGDKVLFSKYDIREGYNNIQIVPEDRWKAAFKMHMGLFEPNVMLFGLQGAPGTFSHMIAVDVAPMYREFLANRFKHYMDDCLVATAEGELTLHRQINHRLLQIFEEHSYFLKPSKCVFKQLEVDFLGVRLGHGEISIDPSKIAGIKDWPTTLKSVKEVRSTLGILGFQRPFIPGFTDIAKPLTNLLKKSMTFDWTPACTMALVALCDIITSEPVLVPPDQERQFILEVDAS